MLKMKHLEKVVKIIQRKTTRVPRVALILGSGLKTLVDAMEDAVIIERKTLPHYPRSRVEGHGTQVVLGSLAGVDAIVFTGRVHAYEGHTLEALAFPVRVAKQLGAHTLIVTNAAGAINSRFAPGDIMVIEDHLNFVFDSPLVGPNDERFGPRFPDASAIYTPALRERLNVVASSLGIQLRHGVYAWWKGPSYETPAEIRMLKTLGADAVGMSTVPETLAASHMGMQVLGLSCLTNKASGLSGTPLSHEEVLTVAARSSETIKQLIIAFCKDLSVPANP